MLNPDYLFEVSWEVCNKVGGIYTVLSTKALHQQSLLGRHHIFIGPDAWMNTEANPEFTEDASLYRRWRESAADEGIRVRVGYWNIPGRPVAILVDFKQFLMRQNEILTDMWNRFGVDSLSGDWDYKESALFGYAAGRTIESFYRHNLYASDKVVAQFHEWQAGAGLLYLKSVNIPVATVFTTHATVVGRSICGNQLPLYNHLSEYDGDAMASKLGVVSRHSLEKVSAINADVLTTVSGITARECRQFFGRDVDVITPNGFENSFTPSDDDEFLGMRKKARLKLMETASAMTGHEIEGDAVFVGIGGRYEYRNKGIDLFLDALDKFERTVASRPVYAFLMIPSGHNGPVRTLQGSRSTHVLQNPEWDIIMRRINELGLKRVFFIPSYLNGNDGVLNMKYYDLLAGLDATFFPSYYEPWGYTPLESLAFRIPTLTTSLSGFGVWVRDGYDGDHPGITVVERNDDNYFEVVDAVVDRLAEISTLERPVRIEYMKNARKVADGALWENQIKYYQEAWSKALEKIVEKRGEFPSIREDYSMEINTIEINAPSWKSVMVTRRLPEALEGLETLSKNLWWCWNESAKALFKIISPEVWHNSGHNPRAVLDTVSIKRFNALAEDASFLAQLKDVMDEFNAYMQEKAKRTDPSIAYFCMEYGLDASLQIYSGGLGILAGDYLKETSDMNVNLVAVGLLYRYGYFSQVLSSQGDQISQYNPQDFLKIPAEPALDANGEWLTTSVAFPGRNITARVWKVAVGRTDLYLLDTDFEANRPDDRQVTHQLYGGDWENRLKQELLLGIGGIRALRKLGINPQIYHCNEGHAAFTGLERLYEYIQNDNLNFSEALEVVRASSLFTTHTPVPAGHDAFEEGMLRQYIGHYPERLKIDWETLMGLGRANQNDPNERFSMSVLAANISQNVNGVSMLHGQVSKDIFSNMYPGYLPEELHISYVTNGVHYPTWASKEWKQIHARVFGPEFATHHYDKKCFEGIYNVSDEEIWNTRDILKKDLVYTIIKKLSDPQIGSHYSPSQIVKIKKTLRDDVLTIGFARRFATYKRAMLLFSNLDRLDAIVNNPQRPVQFVFAGKAHPADKAGQDLIRQIVEISKQDRFLGKIIFVPGYDITLAKRLVQGVDVWLNNPTRPLEASGTSGEKASMNGVMHFSVLDGWWVEGYKEGAGWALPQEKTYDDNFYQNELDSATIYTIIENEIAPTYYAKDPATGRSAEWIKYIKNTVAQVACNFTTNRMLTDYVNQYYDPQSKRASELVADNYAKARDIAAWKKHVLRYWPDIEVVSYRQPDSSYSLSAENPMPAEVVLNIGDLKPEDVGVEMLFSTYDSKGSLCIKEKFAFDLVEFKDGIATYRTEVLPERTGMYQVATRLYPKNENLPHRQDFPIVRWL